MQEPEIILKQSALQQKPAGMPDRAKDQIHHHPLMLREGEAFVPAMEAAGVFTKTALTA